MTHPDSRLVDEITPLEVPEGVETVGVVIRQVTVHGHPRYAVFTECGKMLAGQGSNAHFIGIDAGGSGLRKQSLRASFVVDGEHACLGPSIK